MSNGRAADHGPALIARCADEDDVATALRYASAREVPVAVRGGGHGSDGHAVASNALVLDLSAMREITVDPETHVVRAQAGVLLGELDAATQEAAGSARTRTRTRTCSGHYAEAVATSASSPPSNTALTLWARTSSRE